MPAIGGGRAQSLFRDSVLIFLPYVIYFHVALCISTKFLHLSHDLGFVVPQDIIHAHVLMPPAAHYDLPSKEALQIRKFASPKQIVNLLSTVFHVIH